jgi:hypothetical protein
MQLTPENKAHIDSLSYDRLLTHWRFAPAGDPWFQDETGKYWFARMHEMEASGVNRSEASKRIGWDQPDSYK